MFQEDFYYYLSYLLLSHFCVSLCADVNMVIGFVVVGGGNCIECVIGSIFHVTKRIED